MAARTDLACRHCSPLQLAQLPRRRSRQTYPTKAIRMIVPFVPGGPTDVQGRWAAQQLNAAFGQPVIVDNRGGGGGVPGTEAVVKSAPDGYTLLAGNPGPLTISPSVQCAACRTTRCAISRPSC